MLLPINESKRSTCSTSSCRFAGTPEEELLRIGGKIVPLEGGGSAVTLTGDQIDDAHAMAIAALGSNHPQWSPVRRIDLSSSRISDTGLDRLSHLYLMEHLDLRHTRVTGDGIRAFREKMPNCQVVWDS